MNLPSDDTLYWREVHAAFRPWVGVAVLFGAACAAALTLTGAVAPQCGIACGAYVFHPIAQRHTP
ncbi:hypothetical protein [Variovorax sp. 770b2]|uniref:hypothetical protein n=1 Tax=Variovorax sp. 770b2 TaxID=1566271 RepID=UPI0008F0418F|nr:hypothetical protein [Variovorax sp. 770b2]SFQ33189.1 hypothetical protein SAMN03159339_6774 [Variovorax sp. 770b2]